MSNGVLRLSASAVEFQLRALSIEVSCISDTCFLRNGSFSIEVVKQKLID